MPKENEKSELYVITCADKLIDYTFTVTGKMNKTYRFTLATRMENYLLDGYEFLQTANLCKDKIRRLEYMRLAYVKFKLFGNFISITRNNKLISEPQFLNIAELLSKTFGYLNRWIGATLKSIEASKNR